MTKQPKKQKGGAVRAPKAKVQFPCRCFPLIDGGYEMYKFNASTGLYEGPYPCTKAQCIKCNTSQAGLITK
jgi:hypothetical protein